MSGDDIEGVYWEDALGSNFANIYDAIMDIFSKGLGNPSSREKVGKQNWGIIWVVVID